MPYTEKELIHEAIRLARQSLESGGSPFGAVIAKDGEVVASAHNQAIMAHDPTAHAEILAIRRAASKLGRRHLPDCILYTSSEPCPMCLAACYWARVSDVVFGASIQDGFKIGLQDLQIYEELRLAPERRKVQLRQLEGADAWEVIQHYKPLG